MQRCDGIVRREFLRVGGLSALGLGLADALRLRPRGEAPPGPPKNCILVWLDGGPSRLETFDLKPEPQRRSATRSGRSPRACLGWRSGSTSGGWPARWTGLA
jgi:hypothetical protein